MDHKEIEAGPYVFVWGRGDSDNSFDQRDQEQYSQRADLVERGGGGVAGGNHLPQWGLYLPPP